jgi:hypothetical protein
MKDFPCDACGKDTGCTCPPCPCRWCRYRRGEATPAEKRLVEAHVAAFMAADGRRATRDMIRSMRAAIERHLSAGLQSSTADGRGRADAATGSVEET